MAKNFKKFKFRNYILLVFFRTGNNVLAKLQWINHTFGFNHGIDGWTTESLEELVISKETCRKAWIENILILNLGHTTINVTTMGEPSNKVFTIYQHKWKMDEDHSSVPLHGGQGEDTLGHNN